MVAGDPDRVCEGLGGEGARGGGRVQGRRMRVPHDLGAVHRARCHTALPTDLVLRRASPGITTFPPMLLLHL